MTARIVIAVLFLVGFYAMALFLIGILIYLPYALWTLTNSGGIIRIVFSCVAAAGIILWSVIPRPDRFAPPGPKLDATVHPRLFEEISQVAAATDQKMPSEVYAVLDLNAGVSHRGGIMGFGSRRVMLIGLPLLQILTVTQLRAVLAHEFGHFHGGDVALGPWIYKTRCALGRAIQGLSERHPLLQKPFIWYGLTFLKISRAISRHQEFAADQVSARIVGSQTLIEAINLTYEADQLYDTYWTHEVAPALSRDFRPPIADGFGIYLNALRSSAVLPLIVGDQGSVSGTNPYDTHPSPQERIEALQDFEGQEMSQDRILAISLLTNIDELEERLLNFVLRRKAIYGMKRLDWDEVGLKVWLPYWHECSRKYVGLLSVVTFQMLPELSADLNAFARVLVDDSLEKATLEEKRKKAASLLAIGISAALGRKGWKPTVALGKPVMFEFEGMAIEPFETVGKLASGELTSDSWKKLCAESGIADLPLVDAKTVS